MRFAICNETFQDWPFEKAFAYARELGYTGIEYAPFTMTGDGPADARRITAEQRKTVRNQADAAGLEAIGLHWLLAKTEGFYLTTPDAVVRKRTSEYIGELARLCRDLGGSVMVLGSPKQRDLLPGVSLEQATELAADCLKNSLSALEQYDVTIALEPLAPADTNFLNTADSAVELADRIDHPKIQLHLDVKAMCSEPTPIPEIIRKHISRTAHFHANDANLQGPGMGEIDFVPIFQALKDTNYRGWVSVEVFDYAPGIEALASNSIAYMRETWAKVA
jgi:sugar phosphate isomerase/epimerase